MIDKLTLSDIEYCVKLNYSFVQIPIQVIDYEKNVILSLPNNHIMNNFLITHPWIEALFTSSENKPYFETYENMCVFASILCLVENKKYFILIGPTKLVTNELKSRLAALK